MGRPTKDAAEMNAVCGFGPLRQYWQEINRDKRAAEKKLTAKRKAGDKKRKKCTCKAYPWPHRPGGGLCRWPDPPIKEKQALREPKFRTSPADHPGERLPPDPAPCRSGASHRTRPVIGKEA